MAKMDATINELPHTKVRSFPTIKLYKKETNEAVEYNGESEYTLPASRLRVFWSKNIWPTDIWST